MELKQKLSQLRKDKGLTQLELAETLTVSRQAVSRWEVGTAVPSLENLVSLSKVYGVPLDYLVHDEQEEPEEPQNAPAVSVGGGRRTVSVRTLALALCVLIAGVVIGVTATRQDRSNAVLPVISTSTFRLMNEIVPSVKQTVTDFVVDIKFRTQIELSNQTFLKRQEFELYGHTLIGYVSEGKYDPDAPVQEGNTIVVGTLPGYVQKAD